MMDKIKANLWMLAAGLFAALSLALFVATVNQTITLDGLKLGPFKVTGVRERLTTCQADLERAEGALETEQGLRKNERDQAERAASLKAEQCRVDIARARSSGRMIEKVTYVETTDNHEDRDGAGGGGLIGPVELRVIHGQDPDPRGSGLPGGGDSADPGRADHPGYVGGAEAPNP